MKRTPTPPVLAAACGNRMAGDDAFGPLVAEQLRRQAPAYLEVADLGMKPAGLLDLELADRRLLILLDAACFLAEGNPPAPRDDLLVMDFHDPARPRLVHDARLSSHGFSLADDLQLAQRIGCAPERCVLIAAVAESTEIGRAPTPRIRKLIQLAVNAALHLAEEALPTGELNHA